MNVQSTRLGAVVYRWGRLEQNHLVGKCLVPWAREELETDAIQSVLYDRFDSRGPHVLFLATVERQQLSDLRGQLETRVARYLEENPDPTRLSEAELAEHHAGCRGKIQCEIDRSPGFGTLDTAHFFEHPENGYPFFSTREHPEHRAIWREMSRLSLWTAEQLPTRGDGIALLPSLGFLLAVDAEARRKGWAESFWRYYASTLLVDLDRKLAEDENRVVAELPELIGEDNLARLPKIWAAAARLPRPENLGPLVDLVVPESAELDARSRFSTMRELSHLVLKQLGWPVPRHVPPILYAWWRAAEVEPGS